MPRVPTYEPGQVQRRALDTTRRTGPGAEAFGGNVGQSVQRLGRAVEGVSDLSQRLADQQADIRAREADIHFSAQVREQLTGEDGLMKRQGQVYVDSAPEYVKRIETAAEQARAMARNDAERRMIDIQVSQRLEQTRAQIASQGIRESQFANRASAAARVSNQTTNVQISYRDPQAYARELAVLDAAIVDSAEAQGVREPAVLQAMKREKLNEIHTYAVADMIQKGETGPAQAWLNDALAKGYLAPSTAVRLQEQLDKSVEENEIGALVEGEAPPTAVDAKLPRATPALVAAVTHQESRGNGEAVSPKGAAGVMQVMPATGPEAAKLANVSWQPERMVSKKPDDVAYQTKLGEAYLNKQLQDFGGSVVVALAAYNAGPGAARKWIKQFGDPAKGEISAREWAAKIPYAETKSYVASITKALGGSQKAPLPQDVRTIEQAEAWAQQFEDPKQRRAARAAALSKVNLNRAAESQRQSDAWDAAQPYIQAEKPWTAIPKPIWNGMSPQHQTAMIEAQRKGADRATSPETLDRLYGLIETNPQAFKEADLLVLAPHLSKSDFEQFRKMQSDARRGTGDQWKAPAAQYSDISQLAADVAPPDMLKSNAKEELATFKSRWFSAVQLTQQQTQKPLTHDEIRAIGTRMLAGYATGEKTLFGKPKTKPLYEVGVDVDPKTGRATAADIKVIPAQEYERVRVRLAQTYGRAPTNREVLDTWRAAKAVGVGTD